MAAFSLDLEGVGEERGPQRQPASSLSRNNASLPSPKAEGSGNWHGLHAPEAPYPVTPKNNDQAVSHPPRPLLTALDAAASQFFPTLTPLSRKASLSSTALPKDLLVLFTSIANEEAAGVQAQTSSLLQNVRVPGCLGLPGPWERPEMQRSFSPPQGVGPQGFGAQGLPPQVKAQTLW